VPPPLLSPAQIVRRADSTRGTGGEPTGCLATGSS